MASSAACVRPANAQTGKLRGELHAASRPIQQKKLDYLDDKGLVDSPEDFIARAATESSMSGEPYQVNCQGQLQRSADWLNGELTRLRQAR